MTVVFCFFQRIQEKVLKVANRRRYYLSSVPPSALPVPKVKTRCTTMYVCVCVFKLAVLESCHAPTICFISVKFIEIAKLPKQKNTNCPRKIRKCHSTFCGLGVFKRNIGESGCTKSFLFVRGMAILRGIAFAMYGWPCPGAEEEA